MGCGIEPRTIRYRRAESLYSLEGNICGTVMRGAVALPGSKATSRARDSIFSLNTDILAQQPSATWGTIILFTSAGWEKPRQKFRERLISRSTALFTSCIDKYIDHPGEKDRNLFFVLILAFESKANEIPTF